ncbi:hypothetical protein GRF59_20690 [Paenibacillus sp. HJL G12]|uniref:Uncharacterized protein n=1 Tax=Paenibacillus dendrobii TaxID=2691084 RepID=A0A7X3LHP2_9BACL|nr:hypothetical protein [Paenibacillus dendrobii]MWV46041.1 hypothetical protein [Paenibacillus dendrobii]
MNVQNILKRTALSALMFSAVAAPAVTNADSSHQSETPAAKTQAAIAISAKDGNNMQDITITKISDPLALAKKYAPETVADWQKTLEQFKKTFASETMQNVIVSKAVSLKDASGVKMDKSELSVPMTVAQPVPSDKPIFSVEKIKDISGEKTGQYEIAVPISEAKTIASVKISPSTATLKDDISGEKTGQFELAVPAASLTDSKDKAEMASLTVSFSTIEAKGAESAFGKAWTALTEAEESNNADAIKKALAELLQQYKQQIAEKEAAAK